MRCMIPAVVAVEVEDSIKRYLLAHPELLPDDKNITTVDDFDIQLADFFDAMSGVSCGSWITGYLASKGGNGASAGVLENDRIARKYGRILPGQALGLEVFFTEFGPSIFPGGLRLNFTPPAAQLDLSMGVPDFSALAANPTALPSLLPTIEIPGLNAPVYPVEGLEEALELFLGDVMLSELSTYFVAYAYDLVRRQALYFIHDTTPSDKSVTLTSHAIVRNSPREFDEITNAGEGVGPDSNVERELDFHMKDILRASSALAGFFEAKQMSPLGREDIMYSFIDGAAVTNNPALQALVFLSTQPRLIPIREIAMISLGTGVVLQDVSQNIDASSLGWLANNALLTIRADSNAENVQAQVDFLFYGNPDVLPGQYLRVQVAEDAETDNGDALSRTTEPDDLPSYKRIGQTVAKRYRKSIDQFVSEFIFA